MKTEQLVHSRSWFAAYAHVVFFVAIITEPALGGMLRTVALTADPTPGYPAGSLFGDFPSVLLSREGLTAFHAYRGGGGLNTSNSGIWSERSGTLQLVARELQQAPGIPTTLYFDSMNESTGFRLIGNDIGQVSILQELTPSSNGSVNPNIGHGIWSEEADGTLSFVIRGGDHAPGTPAGANLTNFGISVLRMNNLGQTAFAANLATGSGGVTNDDNAGLWFESDGAIQLVAREGFQAADLPAGAIYALFVGPIPLQGFRFVSLNNVGQLAFQHRYEYLSQSTNAIWSGTPGSLQLAVGGGDQAPGMPVGAVFQSFGDTSSALQLNDQGQLLFRAGLEQGLGGITSANDFGVWSQGGGTLHLVAGEGNQAPDLPAGVLFGNQFTTLSFNNFGQSAFENTLLVGSGGVTAANNSTLWSEGGGSLHLVARQGSPAPDTAPGSVFSSFSNFAINELGQSMFRAFLIQGVGGVTAANDEGLWVEDIDGIAKLIVREGQTIDVNDGHGVALRTISTLESWSFNDRGQVAFAVRFTNGTHGVFVSHLTYVPEPGSIVLAVLAAVGLRWLRGRDRLRA